MDTRSRTIDMAENGISLVGRREQPLPPRKQTATNHSPASQNIPPVQKIPAKIEFPPTLVFAGFFVSGSSKVDLLA